MPTRADVARMAGVSPSTVTRALNSHPAIPAHTVRRVLDAAEELGYVPSRVSRGHFQRKSYQIGVVIPFTVKKGRIRSVSEEYFSRCLFGIAEGAAVEDYSVSLITDTGRDAPALAQEVLSRRVDGLIFLGSEYGDGRFALLAKEGIPFVVVHNRTDNDSIPFVDTDSRPGYEELFDLISRKNIDRIGVLHGDSRHYNAIERRGVIEELSSRTGVSIVASHVGRFSRSGGGAAAASFLRAPLPPLIIAANDRMAFGLCEAFRDSGIEVPRRVAVTGFDDSNLSTLLTPPLTTIHNPFGRVGKAAAELLLARIAGERPDNVIFPSRLVVRRSFF